MPRVVVASAVNGGALGAHGAEIGGELSAVMDAMVVEESKVEGSRQAEDTVEVERLDELFRIELTHTLGGARHVFVIPGDELGHRACA